MQVFIDEFVAKMAEFYRRKNRQHGSAKRTRDLTHPTIPPPMASADEKSFDDINVTPMVDLYLVLLLIFIIMTTAGVQGVKVNLPSASSKPATQKLGCAENPGHHRRHRGQDPAQHHARHAGRTRKQARPRSRPPRPTSRSSCAATAPTNTRASWTCSTCSAALGINQIGLATQPAR